MIDGLSHITFVVRDLEAMTAFLKGVFDAEEIYSSGNDTFSVAREKFFLVGGVWIAIMEGESLPGKTYNHVAFKIDDDEYDAYVRRLHALSVDVREGRSRVSGEGRSLYFYDNNNHLFELHTGTLGQRLRRYERPRPDERGQDGPAAD